MKNTLGIKTLYGGHTYGCKSQEEYDAVMNILQEKTLITLKWTTSLQKDYICTSTG